MRLRSGDGSIGDFSAIIAQQDSTRSWKQAAVSAFNCFLGIFLKAEVDDVGVAGVFKARSICGAALEE